MQHPSCTHVQTLASKIRIDAVEALIPGWGRHNNSIFECRTSPREELKKDAPNPRKILLSECSPDTLVFLRGQLGSVSEN